MGAFSDFDHLHEHIDRMWERLTGERGHPRFRPPFLEPPTDVYQTDESVVVVMELTGMRGQEIEMSITEGQLTIRGEKRDTHHHDGRVYTQMEIACGPFERTVRLPAVVDGHRAAVQYEDGLLHITLPKRQRAAAHRIKVTVKE